MRVVLSLSFCVGLYFGSKCCHNKCPVRTVDCKVSGTERKNCCRFTLRYNAASVPKGEQGPRPPVKFLPPVPPKKFMIRPTLATIFC